MDNYIIDKNGNQFELFISSFTNKIDINYKLVQRSDAKYVSIDRGNNTDRYATKLSILINNDYVDDLLTMLRGLRDSATPVVIKAKEPIFADNINTSFEVTSYVESIDKRVHTMLGVSDVKFTLVAENSSLHFTSDSGIPADMNCLNPKWEGYGTWNTHLNETYNENIYFVDREADSFVFVGQYNLSVDDNARLLNWWRDTRGSVITIDEADWGAANMFGPAISSNVHDVVIKSISYKYDSVNRRTVTVKMLRNGGE